MEAFDRKFEDQSAAEITGDIEIKPTPTLKKLGLPDLKQIETEIKPDADKVQREKEKVTQYMKEIKDKVNSYLSQADLDILSKDPEISNMQIEDSKRQLYKIAQFVWGKITKDNENEENKYSEITYVEMIEQVQSILQQAINEGQKEKRKLFKNSLQCKEINSIQKKKNEIIKTMNQLEEECYLNRDILLQDESDAQEVNIQNTENCSQIINEFSRGLRSEIKKIKDEIKSCNAFRDSNSNLHNFKKTQEKIDENIQKCYDNFDHIASLLNEQGTYLVNTKEEDKSIFNKHQNRIKNLNGGKRINKTGFLNEYKANRTDSDEQSDMDVDTKQTSQHIDMLSEIITLDHCDKLNEMVNQWKFLFLLFNNMSQKESSFKIMNQVIAGAVMEPLSKREEELDTYKNTIVFLDQLTKQFKNSILCTKSYKVEDHCKNQLETINSCTKNLKKKVKELESWSQLNPIKINGNDKDVVMEEDKQELSKIDSDIAQNIDYSIENQLIKNNKMRRNAKKKELEQQKRNQDMIECTQKQADEIEHLQRKLKQYEQDLDNHSKDTEILRRLNESRHIDLDGNE